MDADLLRIILAVLGALVIAGVYWWERQRHADDAESHDLDPSLRDERESDDKREPRLGPWEGYDEKGEGAWGGEASDDDAAAGDVSRSETIETNDRQNEPGQAGSVSLEGPGAEAGTKPVAPPDSMLTVLYIVSRGEPFDGAAIVHAAGHCGLDPGEMDIFHCTLGEGSRSQVLFSMANMVKPGTFPFGAMAEFQSPGLTLFAQFDGSPDDPGRMEELLGTAHALSKELDAELRDEQRQSLTQEKEDDLHERVMALVHRRLAANPV